MIVKAARRRDDKQETPILLERSSQLDSSLPTYELIDGGMEEWPYIHLKGVKFCVDFLLEQDVRSLTEFMSKLSSESRGVVKGYVDALLKTSNHTSCIFTPENIRNLEIVRGNLETSISFFTVQTVQVLAISDRGRS